MTGWSNIPYAIWSLLGEPMTYFFLLLVLVPVWRLWSFFSLPTLAQYRSHHADSRNLSARAQCHSCGSTSFYLWWLFGARAGHGPKKHICRDCGTSLYRT